MAGTANNLVGVIAGTPVDTEFGRRFLAERGWRTLEYAAAQTPEEQDFLQRRHPQALIASCERAMQDMVAQGASLLVVYCSSLSTVLPLGNLARDLHTKIVSPLDFYRSISAEYQKFALLAANAVGLQGAGQVIRRHNPGALLHGLHDLDLVVRIEKGLSPEKALTSDVYTFLREAETHCDVLVLACTHFPYLTATLRAKTALPVRDVNGWLWSVVVDGKTRSVA